MATPSNDHIKAEKRVLCYLKVSQHHGIVFHSNTNNNDEAFVKFQVNKIIAFTNTNWGPQDQSVSKQRLFQSR